ncbi:MAG: nucleoid-structuring protein H-NS, partial [bacterium]
MTKVQKKKEVESKDSWVTYRPEIKVLDCTIRDGGLINEHLFNDELVLAVYNTCIAAGVDYMEMGYKASKRVYSRADHGAWKFCDEADLRRIV